MPAKPFVAAAWLVDDLAVFAAAVAAAIRALANIGFEIRVVWLRVAPHQTAINASKMSAHPSFSVRLSVSS
jgi:hypothetical protein